MVFDVIYNTYGWERQRYELTNEELSEYFDYCNRNGLDPTDQGALLEYLYEGDYTDYDSEINGSEFETLEYDKNAFQKICESAKQMRNDN